MKYYRYLKMTNYLKYNAQQNLAPNSLTAIGEVHR
jgi:hypothetical protein